MKQSVFVKLCALKVYYPLRMIKSNSPVCPSSLLSGFLCLLSFGLKLTFCTFCVQATQDGSTSSVARVWSETDPTNTDIRNYSISLR